MRKFKFSNQTHVQFNQIDAKRTIYRLNLRNIKRREAKRNYTFEAWAVERARAAVRSRATLVQQRFDHRELPRQEGVTGGSFDLTFSSQLKTLGLMEKSSQHMRERERKDVQEMQL